MEVFMTTTQVKASFLFYMFTLFLCLNSFFLRNTAAQVDNQTVVATGGLQLYF